MSGDPDIIPDNGGGAKPKAKRGPGRPRKSERAPRSEKSGAAKRAEKKAGEIGLIRSALTEVLTAPAMLAAAKGDQWGVDHFHKAGPALADQIAVECERNPKLRAQLLKLAQGGGYVMLGVAFGAYALPPLIHYGLIPNPARFGGLGGDGLAAPPPSDSPPQAPFIAPERGPAAAPEAPEPPAEAMQAAPPAAFDGEGPAVAIDPLAAELAAAENGGQVPPPPVEAV